jgi:hypothetical protein
MDVVEADGLTKALARHGLIPRGGFAFGPDDDVPDGPSGAPAAGVVLIGHAGSSIWPHFTRWREAQAPGLANPLDAWSRSVIDGVAGEFGARAVYPFARPYLPFQQWAMRAEGLKPSPLGILMHPEYGLWHAWRGALLFDEAGMAGALTAERREQSYHPCDACAEKPCQKACPVGAHAADPFDHAACLAHVRAPIGRGCLEGGCLDRDACPVGRDHRYGRAHRAFHMRAYATPAGKAATSPAR